MTIRRKVKKVHDGDTFELHHKLRGTRFVRIANKNAPELHQFGGREAKEKLRRRIQGRTVTLQPVGRSYGRTVARVRYNRRLLR